MTMETAQVRLQNSQWGTWQAGVSNILETWTGFSSWLDPAQRIPLLPSWRI